MFFIHQARRGYIRSRAHQREILSNMMRDHFGIFHSINGSVLVGDRSLLDLLRFGSFSYLGFLQVTAVDLMK